MSTQLAPIVGPTGYDPEAASILTVSKAKLKSQLLYAEFTEQHDEEASARAFTMQGTELVHPDLQYRLAHLVPHLCLLAEQLTEPDDFWPEDEATELPEHFASFSVTGFSMGRGQAGVTLIGQRQLAGGKVLNLTSPYLAFEEENLTTAAANTAYPYAGRLETAVLAAISEVEQALRGKCSEAGRQLDLFDGPAPGPDPKLLGHDETRDYVRESVASAQPPAGSTEAAPAAEQPVKKRKANRIAK